jgi:hypothetical protein
VGGGVAAGVGRWVWVRVLGVAKNESSQVGCECGRDRVQPIYMG